jgi:hypothetical protein
MTPSTTGVESGESFINVDLATMNESRNSNCSTSSHTIRRYKRHPKERKKEANVPNNEDDNILTNWWMERRMNVIHSQLLPSVGLYDQRPQSAGSYLEHGSIEYRNDLLSVSDLTPRPSTSHAEQKKNPSSIQGKETTDKQSENLLDEQEKSITIQHKVESLEEMLSLETDLKKELKRLRILKKKEKH